MSIPAMYRVRLRFDGEVPSDGTIAVHFPDDGKTYDWAGGFSREEAGRVRARLVRKPPFDVRLLSADVIVSDDGGWNWRRADDPEKA